MMKTGKVFLLSFALFAWSMESVVAQDGPLPQQAVDLDVVQLEPDDAPPPVADVFEAPAFAPVAPPVAHPATIPPTLSPAPSRRGEGVDRVRLTLADGSQLIGEIPVDAKIKLRTRIGDGELALSDATRIDEAGDKGKFRVTLTGGDRFTGEIDFGTLKLKTAVGEVPLGRSDLVSFETGKIYEQEIAERRTSRDGRTSTTTYRRRSVFEPTLSPSETPHYNSTYPSTATYSAPPVTTYILPSTPVAQPLPAN